MSTEPEGLALLEGKLGKSPDFDRGVSYGVLISLDVITRRAKELADAARLARAAGALGKAAELDAENQGLIAVAKDGIAAMQKKLEAMVKA